MKPESSWITALFLSAVGTFGGCATSGSQLALEDNLREQEAVIRDLQKKVADSERLLKDQDAELAVLRDGHSSVSATSVANGRTSTANLVNDGASGSVSRKVSSASFDSGNFEDKVAWGSVVGLRIHRLTSGLVVNDADGKNTERTFNAVLQPFDHEGELVKVAGGITLGVSLAGMESTPRSLATQTISLTESRSLWSRGLISSGFHVPILLKAADIPEPSAASGQQLLITATLDLGNGRVFSANELYPLPSQ